MQYSSLEEKLDIFLLVEVIVCNMNATKLPSSHADVHPKQPKSHPEPTFNLHPNEYTNVQYIPEYKGVPGYKVYPSTIRFHVSSVPHCHTSGSYANRVHYKT